MKKEEIRPITCSCVSGYPDDNCITSSRSLIGRDGWIMRFIDTLHFLHRETHVDRRRSDGGYGAETDASPHPTDRAGRPIAIHSRHTSLTYIRAGVFFKR